MKKYEKIFNEIIALITIIVALTFMITSFIVFKTNRAESAWYLAASAFAYVVSLDFCNRLKIK